MCTVSFKVSFSSGVPGCWILEYGTAVGGSDAAEVLGRFDAVGCPGPVSSSYAISWDAWVGSSCNECNTEEDPCVGFLCRSSAPLLLTFGSCSSSK